MYWLKRVAQGLIYIYGQPRSPRSHSISTGAPRVHGPDKDQSPAVFRRDTRFGNDWEVNGRGRAKVVGFLYRFSFGGHASSTFHFWPLREVRCGTPHPHSSVLSTGDVRVSIDRRTIVNVITQGRRIPYAVNVKGPSMTATWIKGNGKSVPSEIATPSI